MDQIKKEGAERFLLEFVRQAWHIIEPQTRFVSNWHIEAICEHLEALSRGQIENIIINVPPGFSKSLIVSVFFQTWLWIKKPNWRWFNASYAQPLSTRDSLRCRWIIESQWYQDRWGDRFQFAVDENLKTQFANNKGGWRISTSVGGIGTGQHPDCIVVDDPHNVRQSESDKQREDAIEWWTGTMTTRGITRDVRRVLIMQRLHQKDLSGYLLASGEHWEHICLPMEFEKDRMKPTILGWTDPRTVEGELLWPELFNEKKVASLKASLGERAAGQLQQRPVKREGSTFSSTQFKYFKVIEVAGRESVEFTFEGRTVVRFVDECLIFQTIDTASKTGNQNDYTVVATFLLTPENDLLIWDVVRERLVIPKQFGFLMEQRHKHPGLILQAVEDRSSGTGLIQEAAMNGTPFYALSPDADKVSRCIAIGLMYQNGKVYHRAQSPWIRDFEDELTTFPRGSHDDQVDVLAYAGILVSSGIVRNFRNTESAVLPTPQSEDERKASMGLAERLGII